MRVLVLLALFLCVGANSALAQSEPLQPGDTLQISVLQDPKLDRQVVIAPDGMIAFPLAGSYQGGWNYPAIPGKSSPRPTAEKLHRQIDRHGFIGRGQSD